LFDSKDPYLVEHGEHPDNFQQELGQKIAPYKQETPVEENKAFSTVRSNASERVKTCGLVKSNEFVFRAMRTNLLFPFSKTTLKIAYVRKLVRKSNWTI
jgi:hypothetical protein